MTDTSSSLPDVLGAQLTVRDLSVVYDGAVRALADVSLEVPSGAVVAMLGGNGAGKTSLVLAVAGLLGFHRGRITQGEIALDGRSLRGLEPAAIVRAGVAQVLQGKRVLTKLTVEENLQVAGFTSKRGTVQANRARVLELFPALGKRLRSRAGGLSGGEQQMLAFACALMPEPKLLLVDEPSLGLAPPIVDRVRHLIGEIGRSGTSVLLIEQNARMALSVADYGYVMQNGRVVLEGTPELLLSGRDIQDLYLGGLARSGHAGHRTSGT
ncbi:MAG: ABC transporter ATP-binding protein [Nitriliruptorales bacterium]